VELWLQAQGDVQQAMNTDAANGTHPIITPIRDVLQASSAFDSITYEKGAAVIRMLEAYVGEQQFRAGVRRYNARPCLWQHRDRRPVERNRCGEPEEDQGYRPRFQFARRGALIGAQSARCERGEQRLTLTQSRFAIDDSAKAGAQLWRVPSPCKRSARDGTQVIVSGSGATRRH